jgi:hypothetical protein
VSGGERTIASILFRREGNRERHFVVFGVEVACYGDQLVRVGIEHLLQKQPQLQRLAGAPHRGKKISLPPSSDCPPHEGLELLSGHVGGKRCAQVQVDKH